MLSLSRAWDDLPAGARAAIEEQWAGLASGGLPCGASLVAPDGAVVAAGRNRAYDPAGPAESLQRYPLQHNRLAHAELNALAKVPTEADHAALTMWCTQHPCLMCASAARFAGVGKVLFIADDPSDHSSEEARAATRGKVPYERLGDPVWWTVCNLLFLYGSVELRGPKAANLESNRERYPGLVALAIRLAEEGELGRAARSGTSLVEALEPHAQAIAEVSRSVRPS